MLPQSNKIEIITIGDELLIGQTIDTNSAWIGKQINDIGWETAQISSVSDKKEHIIEALKLAEKRASVIIITGGLGPTKDDITKKTLAEYFGYGFKTDASVIEHLKLYFEKRKLPLLDINLQQADVPENCRVLFNEYGTAPGMLFEENNKIYVSLPGVPHEMMHLIKTYILPLLSLKEHSGIIIKKNYLTTGIGESFLSKKISDLEDNLPPEIGLAYLPNYNFVTLRFTAKGNDKNYLENHLTTINQKLYELVGEYIVNEGDENISQLIANILTEKHLKIATAESCSGGNIASVLSSFPGSSAYFEGSIVSYSYDVKMNVLKVKPETLQNYGAVSEQTVIEMCDGCLDLINANIAIAVSGIAGPSGGTPEKPIGTVWIAVGNKNDKLVQKFLFNGTRQTIVERTTLMSLEMVRKFVNIYSLHHNV